MEKTYKRIIIDISNCVGCSICEQLCPEVFKLDTDDVAKVTGNICSQHDPNEVAMICPTDAIKVE